MKPLKHALADVWSLANLHSGGLVAPILCYHSVNDAGIGAEWDPMPTATFERHLKHLNAHYNVVGVDALSDALGGRKSLPERPVVVTFDDGYRDNYEIAYPLLQRYRVPATIYVVSRFVNGEIRLIPDSTWDPLTWNQVRAMSDEGLVSIGAHTKSHHILSDLCDSEAREEVIGSKTMIEEQIGHVLTSFAYPNGQGADISRAAVTAVREAGFTHACSTIWRTAHKPSQRFLLNRVMMNGADDDVVLERKLQGAYDYIYAVHKVKALYSAVVRRRGVWL